MENGCTVLVSARHLLFVLSASATCATVGYCLLCLWAVLKFLRKRATPLPEFVDLPSVSILKPLKGTDPAMYEALRSHCTLDYRNYEILFGVTAENDPAAAVVKKLMVEFPQANIRLLVCKKRLGTNGKVSTLAQLVPHANHDFLLVNDSDIRVEAGYLQTIVRELLQPQVGMVTCLYRGAPAKTIGSKLEALGIGTDFSAGVLAAWRLEGEMRFGLGSTLLFRKHDLQKIGGFDALTDYLADDYELGKRIAEQNLTVVLSSMVVETHLPDYDLSGFISHQLRWARTIRASRPAGYFGLLLTFTLPWVVASFALRPGFVSGGLLVAGLLVRYAMAVAVTRTALRNQQSTRLLWLLPIRDGIAVAIWFGGFFGNKIRWRGEVFRLRKGKLVRA